MCFLLGEEGDAGGELAMHRCKATTAPAADGQTGGPLFPQTHTHSEQQVCPRPAHGGELHGLIC